MIRHLQNRLSRLEAVLRLRGRGPIRLRYIEKVDQFEPLALGENERIVIDIYQRTDRGLVEWARERVTSDPTDQGRTCDAGRCLEDVLREKGRNCERAADGTCRRCAPGLG